MLKHYLFNTLTIPMAIAILSCTASCGKKPESDLLMQLKNPDTELWETGLLHQPKQFAKALDQLDRFTAIAEAKFQDLDALFYYLRAYSYFGPLGAIDDLHWFALDKVLTQLRQHPLFIQRNDQAARLQEHFVVTLYRYYNRSPLSVRLTPHLDSVYGILNRYAPIANGLSEQERYSLLEAYRAIGFLAYEARNTPLIKLALLANIPSTDVLLNNAQSTPEGTGAGFWRLQHALWALGNLRALGGHDDDIVNLDETVWQLLSKDLPFLKPEDQRKLYTRPYLVTSYRGKSACDNEFSGRCHFPEVQSVLPITHSCSPTLLIRANSISEPALAAACDTLLTHESDFHHKLQSRHKPVDKDHNDRLEVVVFDNYSQYNEYASLLFDINTNNGGMFLEGDPGKAGNQARLFAFEAFWTNPDFSIWNLEHEYVHYLDGRFNKRGGFGHFPSHMVWWSEGLANYIAHGDHYDSAERDLRRTRPSEYPTLEQIFSTTYADGTARVYSWSYLAIRFLYQENPDNLVKLATHLREDNFEDYRNQLDQFSQRWQSDFFDWLTATAPTGSNDSTEEKLPRKRYRYLYRNYLQPANLPQTPRHYHHI
ncbi:collagenase [Microbulbifer spongiae]|uniref:Collagenase n=1 Tax=Microbulbifer spongiae TaxID=2944933 RepID=A0ABY9E706_9GAMM|nr:collagenase [Microbulbifer sp. MI-G]WKD48131.1 collagenase [Microbulbifer sp. MI-G]